MARKKPQKKVCILIKNLPIRYAYYLKEHLPKEHWKTKGKVKLRCKRRKNKK